MLPKQIRRDIWRCYRRGQEITKDPSPDYVWAASRAREWIYENYPTARPSAPATLADVWPEVHA